MVRFTEKEKEFIEKFAEWYYEETKKSFEKESYPLYAIIIDSLVFSIAISLIVLMMVFLITDVMEVAIISAVVVFFLSIVSTIVLSLAVRKILTKLYLKYIEEKEKMIKKLK